MNRTPESSSPKTLNPNRMRGLGSCRCARQSFTFCGFRACGLSSLWVQFAANLHSVEVRVTIGGGTTKCRAVVKRGSHGRHRGLPHGADASRAGRFGAAGAFQSRRD